MEGIGIEVDVEDRTTGAGVADERNGSGQRDVPKQHAIVLVVTSVPPPAAGRHGEPVATCLGHRALFVHEQVLRIERDPRLE